MSDRGARSTILLVEDNPDHARFTLKALADGARTYWVKDGQEALDYLHHEGQWADPATAPRPDLILLDIHLPKIDGREVLQRLKGDESLRCIPIVMLTTSDHSSDVEAAYRAGANSYVAKPVKFSEYMDQVKALKNYWTVTSRLPAA